MAAVPITIDGVLFDKYGRTTQLVRLMGEATLTGLAPGHPLPPVEGPVDPGYGYPEKPVDPGYGIPGPPYPGRPPVGIWPNPPEGTAPLPEHPIYYPPPNAPQPDPPVQPGDPTTPVPPPTGSGGWTVQPITPPPYIVVNYPGIGPVRVAPPANP